MNSVDWNIWTRLAFTTRSFRKNFDMVSENENFITECEGTISEIRIEEKLLPRIIGDYRLSIWNIELGISLNADFEKLIKEYSLIDTYSELKEVINNEQFHINYYHKIVFIHSFVLVEEYKKHGITEEFIETIYREYYGMNMCIILLVKPIQNNSNEFDTYSKHKKISVKQYFNSTEDKTISSDKYFSFDNLIKKTDKELNEYKLFSKATDCGFKRIGDSHLFVFSPEKIMVRMKAKYDHMKIINVE